MSESKSQQNTLLSLAELRRELSIDVTSGSALKPESALRRTVAQLVVQSLAVPEHPFHADLQSLRELAQSAPSPVTMMLAPRWNSANQVNQRHWPVQFLLLTLALETHQALLTATKQGASAGAAKPDADAAVLAKCLSDILGHQVKIDSKSRTLRLAGSSPKTLLEDAITSGMDLIGTTWRNRAKVAVERLADPVAEYLGFNLDGLSVVLRDGTRFSLPGRSAELLQFLFDNREQEVTHEHLFEAGFEHFAVDISRIQIDLRKRKVGVPRIVNRDKTVRLLPLEALNPSTRSPNNG
jgi:hypothetical protein